MSNSRGFTLIEVLVALALMAMISTILIASLTLGEHTWQRVIRMAANTEEVAQTQDFLRERLSSLVYVPSFGDDAASGFLSSDGTQLEFTAVSEDSAMAGVRRYRVSVSSSSKTLQVQSFAIQSGAVDINGSLPPERLLAHVDSITFQFWVQPVDGVGRWVSQWTDRTQVPTLIRIDANFSSQDTRGWPTLYIESHADTPSNCAFDVVSRRCRSEG